MSFDLAVNHIAITISVRNHLVVFSCFFFLPRAFTFSFTLYHRFKLISFNILNRDVKYFEQVACEKHVMLKQMQPLLFVRKTTVHICCCWFDASNPLSVLFIGPVFISSLIESWSVFVKLAVAWKIAVATLCHHVKRMEWDNICTAFVFI